METMSLTQNCVGALFNSSAHSFSSRSPSLLDIFWLSNTSHSTSLGPVWLRPVLALVKASLVAQMVKRLPAMLETWAQSLGRKIPWRRKWQSTPVLLPGKSHGWRSLAGYSPWDCKESDTTEQLHSLCFGQKHIDQSTGSRIELIEVFLWPIGCFP